MREMSMSSSNFTRTPLLAALAATILMFAPTAHASDHGDTAVLKALQRHDARITDLHVFSEGDDLVLSLSVDPTAPLGTTYVFPEDLKLGIFLDNHSDVTATGLLPFGGSVSDPAEIDADIAFVVTFARGRPKLRIYGGRMPRRHVRFFAGLRDDPFIRTPRHGKNVATVVIQVPLRKVTRRQPTLLIWATSEVDDFPGPRADLAGRALRSQFEVTAAKIGEMMDNPLNVLHPADHFELLGTEPDVVIFDTSQPAVFPNGRRLTDDVIRALDLDLPGEDPGNRENDVPFLNDFPYLAPPHE
jgi:hypothetical protein